MYQNFLLAWPLAWISLFTLYGLQGGQQTFGHPWVASLIFFSCWAGLESLNRPAAHRDPRQASPKNRAPGQKKVLNLKDYQAKDTNRPSEQGWTSVYPSDDPAMIGMVQSILASREIQTKVINLHAASFFPNVEGINMEIWVLNAQADAALKILIDHSLIPPVKDSQS